MQGEAPNPIVLLPMSLAYWGTAVASLYGTMSLVHDVSYPVYT